MLGWSRQVVPYLLAVLPDGCLINERDRAAWEALRDRYRVEILRDNARSAFRGVRARTSLVRFSRVNDACKVVRLQSITPPDEPLRLVRGTCQMHTVGGLQHKRGKPLVHTSHLCDGKVDCSGVKVKHGLWIDGPAVLFPRVGRATPDKIAILTQGMSVVLSDCVFALQCTTNREARMSRGKILKSWANFAECYRGTGAPHITAARAGVVLASIARIPTSIPWTTTTGTSAPEHQQAQLPAD